MSVFETLNSINVNEHTEKKSGLTYLSWPWAWGEVKKHYPDATYTIYENKDGWNYHTDGRTAWVKTGVTVDGLEHIEMLPVMDYKNKSIPLDKVTSFDVNKAIQRSLTKAAARHGLGLYIYAGEDLPEAEAEEQKQKAEEQKPKKADLKSKPSNCEVCGEEVKGVYGKNNEFIPAYQIIALAKERFGKTMCAECTKMAAEAERKKAQVNANAT
jgi:hypothetical protein